jgi:hypothetical protein
VIHAIRRAESYLEPSEAPSPTACASRPAKAAACFQGRADPIGVAIEQIQQNQNGSTIRSKNICSIQWNQIDFHETALYMNSLFIIRIKKCKKILHFANERNIQFQSL